MTEGSNIYNYLDGLTVFTTNFAIVQDLTGLNSAINLNGTVTTPKESFSKGLDGYMTTFLFFLSTEKEVLKSSAKYSEYASKEKWTKSIYSDKKQFLRNQANASVAENSATKKQSAYFQGVLDIIQLYFNQ